MSTPQDISAIFAERRATLSAIQAEISTLWRVSPDSAVRLGAEADGISRTIAVLESGVIRLGGAGARPITVIGLGALPPAKLVSLAQGNGARKAGSNYVLLGLDGLRGEIRLNHAGTAWVIDLASPRGTTLLAWERQTQGNGRAPALAGPRVPTTQGGAHWVGIVSATMPIDPEAAPRTTAWIAEGMTTLARTGRTPMQECAQQNALRAAESAARSAAERLVIAAAISEDAVGSVRSPYGEWTPRGIRLMEAARAGADEAALVALIRAERQAVEEARLMAELEAEEQAARARLAAEQAETQRLAALAATLRACGSTAAQWGSMTPKQQGLAAHRARLAGRL